MLDRRYVCVCVCVCARARAYVRVCVIIVVKCSSDYSGRIQSQYKILISTEREIQ